MRKLIIALVFCVFCLSALNGLITYEEKVKQKRNVYNKTLEFIKKHPQSAELSKLYFNVAELSTELEAENPALIASYYKNVLADKNFTYRDAALYNYGFYNYVATKQKLDEKRRQWLINEGMNYPENMRYSESNYKQTIDSYLEIYNNKSSEYHSEVLLRLGEIYFQIEFDAPGQKVYDQSLKYFDELVKKSNSDELWVFGLFNRGWTYFNASNYENSIADFSQVLDFLEKTKSTELEAYFEDGALRTIAENLIEFDGNDYDKSSEAASKAMEILLPNIDKDYGKESILRTIALKKRYRAPMQAIDLYNVYINSYPLDLKCPSYIDSISYLLANNIDKVANRYPDTDVRNLLFAEKERLVYNYNTNSNWFKQNQNNDIETEINIIGDAFKDVEARYYNANLEKADEEKFNRYLELTELFTSFLNLTSYSIENHVELMDKRKTELSLDRAVQSFSFDYYIYALGVIDNYNQKYPNQTAYFDYENQLYYSIENIYINNKKSVADSTTTLVYNNQKVTVEVLDSLFITGSIRFENALNDARNILNKNQTQEQIIHVLTNRAAAYYTANKVDEAYVTYEKLLSYNPENELKALCYGRMAEISYNKGNFDLAINYYDEGIKYSSATEKKNFEQNRLSSMQAKADNLSSAGSLEESATEYLKLANDYKGKDNDKRLGYINKAIEAYTNANQYQKAIDLYLLIATETKDKTKITAAYGSAWSLAEENNDIEQGIKLRYDLIKKYPTSNTAFELEKEIIAKYATNNKKKAAEMLLNLHSRAKKLDLGNTKPSDLYIEAMRLYEELGDEEELIGLYLKFEKLYPKHEISEGLLIKAAQYYEKTGQDEEFRKLSIYMYKKNPELDFYKNIAKKNIRDIMQKVEATWNERSYYNHAPTISKLAELKDEYQKMVNKYRKNGLKDLSYDLVFDMFSDYDKTFKFLKKFEREITKAKQGFLSKTPKQLIRVNRNTTWSKHLVGGNLKKGRHRFKKVLDDAKKESEKLANLLNQAVEKGYLAEIPMERRTYLLYTCGQINEHAANAIDAQLQYYIKYANELAPFKKNKEEFDKIVANNFLPATQKYTVLALVASRDYYLYMLNNFFFTGAYFDKYTDAALTWLVSKQIPLDWQWTTSVTDNTWKANSTEVSDIKTAATITNMWENVSDYENTGIDEFSNAKPVNMQSYAGKWLLKEFTAKGQINSVSLRYLAKTPVDVYYNGVKQPEALAGKTIVIDDNTYTVYTLNINYDANKVKHFVALKTPEYLTGKFAATLKAIYTNDPIEVKTEIAPEVVTPDSLQNSTMPDSTNAQGQGE